MKGKTAYGIRLSLVGSEMCMSDGVSFGADMANVACAERFGAGMGHKGADLSPSPNGYGEGL